MHDRPPRRRRCELDEERTLTDVARVTDSISLMMRTHLWISWGRIALKHEAMAHAARQEMQQPGTNQSRLLEQEAGAGLVSICAAAFALEAVSSELNELGLIPVATAAARSLKKPRKPRASMRLLELLKHGFDSHGLVTTWKRELKWLFGARGASVHYEGTFAPAAIHSVGLGSGPVATVSALMAGMTAPRAEPGYALVHPIVKDTCTHNIPAVPMRLA